MLLCVTECIHSYGITNWENLFYYSQENRLHFPEEMASKYQHVTNKDTISVKLSITYHGYKSVS